MSDGSVGLPKAGGEKGVESIAREIRSRHPKESAQYSEAQLAEMVAASLATCGPLQIQEHEDILRYAALRVLITPEQRASPLIRGVAQRILSSLSWSPSKRLDFVYQHIVGRPVSANEPDFGPLFVPPRQP
jgi:hypothetical protein